MWSPITTSRWKRHIPRLVRHLVCFASPTVSPRPPIRSATEGHSRMPWREARRRPLCVPVDEADFSNGFIQRNPTSSASEDC
jgi:hypothetical protein